MNPEQSALIEVKQEFVEWPKQRKNQCPVPLYLWEKVKPLLTEYPRTVISRELGVSPAQIKNNLLEPKVSFVEAMPFARTESKNGNHQLSAEPCCDIELQRPCGSVLKIKSLPASVVATLIPSFVGN